MKQDDTSTKILKKQKKQLKSNKNASENYEIIH